MDRTWRHGEVATSDKTALLHELVRYATLGPSSHNTQCWKFRLEDNAISILPDLSRRCPAVDPDDHHLFISLGCAAENLIQALANGLKGHPGFTITDGHALRVVLEPTRPVASTLFQVIPERQSTRGEYDGEPINRQELQMLEKAGTGSGVQVILLTERQPMDTVLEYVIQGNTAQMNDLAFINELKNWIRFSSDHPDWDGLIRSVRDCGARQVYVTHGNSDGLARYLREVEGISAAPLGRVFEGERGGDGARGGDGEASEADPA